MKLKKEESIQAEKKQSRFVKIHVETSVPFYSRQFYETHFTYFA
jgi:hypothetical protein